METFNKGLELGIDFVSFLFTVIAGSIGFILPFIVIFGGIGFIGWLINEYV